MKYLDDEDKEKLQELGKKILQAKKLKSEITDFFVTKDDRELPMPNYYGTEDLLDTIDLFIEGKSPDYISDQIFQDDEEHVIKIFQLMGIDIEKT